jgi:molybdopterin synthase catalytic subunit/molybdopterin converting factor small subunit
VEVTVRLFAILRERAGAGSVTLELPEGARVRDALDSLSGLAEGIPLVMAVNREYASEEQVLDAGDELALIPPVSGGSQGAPPPTSGLRPEHPRITPWVRVSAERLSLDALAARVRDARAGAVVTFSGVTREVERLDYDAYVQMAEERMATIATEAVERHGLCAAAVEHRIGEVALSEPSVIVAVSAPHRGEAFAGAREIIDRVKAEAPIWKKEIEGGEGRWAEGATPPPRPR